MLKHYFFVEHIAKHDNNWMLDFWIHGMLTFLLFANKCISPNVFRPLTVFEGISNMWNDSTYNPMAPASACHSDYCDSTHCSYNRINIVDTRYSTEDRKHHNINADRVTVHYSKLGGKQARGWREST
jgi:hypothetical protein